ncbi:hypothetical protein L1987_64528 [Smallanthus sonchifolius]|uniref:Uncharacterized protein n=1 Tax=Smallanthus sonchifolius TaxID=185202 RepID=A0ACB9BS49_9ASTR|nr:hypothetical protein L1987_64528 [Smallanthus sonchifolius]
MELDGELRSNVPSNIRKENAICQTNREYVEGVRILPPSLLSPPKPVHESVIVATTGIDQADPEKNRSLESPVLMERELKYYGITYSQKLAITSRLCGPSKAIRAIDMDGWEQGEHEFFEDQVKALGLDYDYCIDDVESDDENGTAQFFATQMKVGMPKVPLPTPPSSPQMICKSVPLLGFGVVNLVILSLLLVFGHYFILLFDGGGHWLCNPYHDCSDCNLLRNAGGPVQLILCEIQVPKLTKMEVYNNVKGGLICDSFCGYITCACSILVGPNFWVFWLSGWTTIGVLIINGQWPTGVTSKREKQKNAGPNFNLNSKPTEVKRMGLQWGPSFWVAHVEVIKDPKMVPIAPKKVISGFNYSRAVQGGKGSPRQQPIPTPVVAKTLVSGVSTTSPTRSVPSVGNINSINDMGFDSANRFSELDIPSSIKFNKLILGHDDLYPPDQGLADSMDVEVNPLNSNGKVDNMENGNYGITAAQKQVIMNCMNGFKYVQAEAVEEWSQGEWDFFADKCMEMGIDPENSILYPEEDTEIDDIEDIDGLDSLHAVARLKKQGAYENPVVTKAPNRPIVLIRLMESPLKSWTDLNFLDSARWPNFPVLNVLGRSPIVIYWRLDSATFTLIGIRDFEPIEGIYIKGSSHWDFHMDGFVCEAVEVANTQGAGPFSGGFFSHTYPFISMDSIDKKTKADVLRAGEPPDPSADDRFWSSDGSDDEMIDKDNATRNNNNEGYTGINKNHQRNRPHKKSSSTRANQRAQGKENESYDINSDDRNLHETESCMGVSIHPSADEGSMHGVLGIPQNLNTTDPISKDNLSGTEGMNVKDSTLVNTMSNGGILTNMEYEGDSILNNLSNYDSGCNLKDYKEGEDPEVNSTITIKSGPLVGKNEARNLCSPNGYAQDLTAGVDLCVPTGGSANWETLTSIIEARDRRKDQDDEPRDAILQRILLLDKVPSEDTCISFFETTNSMVECLAKWWDSHTQTHHAVRRKSNSKDGNQSVWIDIEHSGDSNETGIQGGVRKKIRGAPLCSSQEAHTRAPHTNGSSLNIEDINGRTIHKI